MQLTLAPGTTFQAASQGGKRVQYVFGTPKPLVLAEWMHAVVSSLVRGVSAEKVHEDVRERFGVEITAREIEERIVPFFISKGLLVGDHPPETATGTGQFGLLHNVSTLALRLGILSPRITAWLAVRTQALFLPIVLRLVIIVSLCLVPAVIVQACRSRLLIDPWITLGVLQDALPLFIAASLLSGLVHELGHLAAAGRVGCTPGEMGVGLYLTNMVFYTRLDTAYAFSRKSRILVDFGGMYFELLLVLIISAVALIWPNLLLLTLTLNLAGGILGNMNPLLKYDGYWVFSDLSGVTNLHKKVERTLLAYLRIPGHDRSMPGVAFSAYAAIVALIGLIELGLAVEFLPRHALAYPTFLKQAASGIHDAWRLGRIPELMVAGWRLVMLALLPIGLAIVLVRVLRYGFSRIWRRSA